MKPVQRPGVFFKGVILCIITWIIYELVTHIKFGEKYITIGRPYRLFFFVIIGAIIVRFFWPDKDKRGNAENNNQSPF